ncbi:MAG: chemotaxis protein CheA, partial [Gammaproteobacteria bacterium]
MTLDDALVTFIAESAELLEDMEAALLSIGPDGPSPEAVNAVFRAAHTIKGSAGLFGIDQMVAFTHVAESVLDAVRQEPARLDAALVTLLLECRDHLGALLASVRTGGVAPDPALDAAGAPLVARLRAFLAGPAEPMPSDLWHISLRFGPTVLQNGMDPMSFLRYLGTLGSIESIDTLFQAVPALEGLDPEACYLGFELDLRSQAGKADIEAVFEFVRDDCEIAITPPLHAVRESIALIESGPATDEKLGETLLRAGSVTPHELAAALSRQASERPAAPLGQILIAHGAAPGQVVDAALAQQGKAREARALDNGSVRVDADKLDHLINLVGELIISSASANLIARRANNSQFQECSATLSALVEEVRNSALQLRMVKIGATFGRFSRVVRDVSRELGKDIVLRVSGEDTELDKTVVEKIADPLTHLVRNAMDHGIEPASVRAARGKPPTGTIGLNACHESGTIVIEVADDGGGLNRERIL